MSFDELTKKQKMTIAEISTKIYSAIDNQSVPDVGMAMTQSMALFLSHIDIESPGDGAKAYELLIRGLQDLFEATLQDIDQMRRDGMTKEQLHEALARFIPQTFGTEEEKETTH